MKVERLVTFALSTMWSQHRFNDVPALARAAADLGFPAIEISHTIAAEQTVDLLPGQVAILAVHYPAPTTPSPYGRAADALLSSPDPEARAWAVRQGEQCLRFAADMGARAVCLHLGAVDLPAHWEWALEQRYLGGQAGSSAYLHLRDQIMAERARRQPPFFEAARRSLDELAALAIRYSLRLGVESRRQYREIPSFEELDILLADHAPATVGFWYDPGHVQVLANLGFHQHQPWLDLFAARIVGVHLHDVIGLRDHLLPGLGELDFAHIGRHLPADAVRTFELDWYYEEQELQTGLAHARAAGCIP